MINFSDYVIPPPNRYIAAQAQAHWLAIDPHKTLGQLGELVVRYCSLTGKLRLPPLKTALVIMCGDHGIARYGVSAFPVSVTTQMMNSYRHGVAGANVLARHAGADVLVVDVGVKADLSAWPQVMNYKVAHGTQDFTQGPAMSYEEAIAGIFAGMKVADYCVAQGYNLLVTGEMGIGNTTSSAAIASAILQLSPAVTVGRGSGINDARLELKRKLVTEGLRVNQPQAQDALKVLQKVGGLEHAGLAGLILGGASHGIPTLLDGINATAAALLAAGLCRESAAYMLASHLSKENSHGQMLKHLGLKPLINAEMRLGEGTGACLAVKFLEMARDVWQNA